MSISLQVNIERLGFSRVAAHLSSVNLVGVFDQNLERIANAVCINKISAIFCDGMREEMKNAVRRLAHNSGFLFDRESLLKFETGINVL